MPGIAVLRPAVALLAPAALLIAIAPACAQTGGAAPIYREIKDWVVACDNTRACFAKYVGADEGAAGGGYLSVSREAGPSGRLVVNVLQPEDPDNASGAKALRLDGRQLPALGWTIDKDGDAILQGADALAFIRAIRDGAKLADSDAKDAPFVSLDGMKAALLLADDDQGRLGNVTALVRVGVKPASAVLPALPVPVVHARPTADNLPGPAAFAAAVRRGARAVLKAHDCEAEAASIDEAHALDATTALAMIGCIEGAYQASVITFIAPRAAPRLARVLVMSPRPTIDPANRPAGVRGEYVSGAWDAARASFSESAKGRGVGDCGSSSTWTFDGHGFRLTAYNALERCGGGPPGDWPPLYRARVEAP